MSTIDWTCPFCNREATITQSSYSTGAGELHLANADGNQRLTYIFIVCPNPKCKKFTLRVTLTRLIPSKNERGFFDGPSQSWNLIPPSEAKVFPDYVPKAIRDDYQEACLIGDLSPKASATLARRCLQGMIRDFWNVRRDRLIDEINAIKDLVAPLTWQAIDVVRRVGNIGAHMEKDINLVIDVEPQEAKQLIQLVELLVRDWYVLRHDREEQLRAVVELGKAKKEAKTQTPELTFSTSTPKHPK